MTDTLLTGEALLEHLRTKLERHPFPVLQKTVQRITALVSTSEDALPNLAHIILGDQAFTAHVLSRANQMIAPNSVTSITRAILVLGFSTIRNLAIAAELVDAVQAKLPESVNIQQLLAKAFLSARQADELRQATSLTATEEIFTGALLASIGELALAIHASAAYLAIQERVEQGSSLEKVYHEVIQLDPVDIVNLIIQVYNLPPSLLVPQPDWTKSETWNLRDKQHGVIHLANALAAQAVHPYETHPDAQRELLSKTSRYLSIPTAAIETCLQNAWKSLSNNHNTGQEPTISVNTLQDLFADLQHHIDHQPDLNTILSFVLEIMCRGINFQRVFLLVPQFDKQQLTAKWGIGPDAQAALGSFTTPLNPGSNLLAHILKERLIRNVSIEQPLHRLLPLSVITTLQPQHILLGTLSTPTHGIVLIWGDSPTKPTTEQWLHFQRLIRLANRGVVKLFKQRQTKPAEPHVSLAC